MEELINGFTGFAQKPKDGGIHHYAEADTLRVDPDDVPKFDPAQLARIPEKDRRWAWVQIDLGAIAHNIRAVKNYIGNRPLMAVVKADAYGHGAVRVADAAYKAGADYLGVATIDEAIELREAGIYLPILVLSQPPETAIPLLLGYKVEPSVYTSEFAIKYAETADIYNMKAPFHLAVNTGMNRIGVHYSEVVDFMRQVGFHRALRLKGVFTHFATADCPENLDFHKQERRFAECITALRAGGVDPGIVHCANSAAGILYPQDWCDMVRLGISLYGFYPCPETRALIDLRPAMSVHARIVDTHLVPVGEGVSYGLHYRSTGSAKICTLPIGYGDGFRRGLSFNTDVIYQGRRLPQVGNICMDQCMFECDLRTRPNRPRLDPQIGDEVLIVGRQGNAEITVDELAEKLKTIQHEITIGFAQRLPRVYV